MNLQDDVLYVIVYGPGFGESIVLRDPAGTWVVVDGCLAKEKSPTAELLVEHDAEWSGVVLTHPHADHALGLDSVLEQQGGGPIGCAAPRLRDPRTWQASQDPTTHLREGTVEHVLSVIHDRWTSDPACRWEMKRGDVRCFGQLELTVLHPDEELVANPPDDPNRLSTALQVKWNDVWLLLGSDVVSIDWQDIAAGFDGLDRHTALKFPHHGSEGAVDASWGEGENNRFWMMTPYNRGRKLPRYEDEHGLAWALRHVEKVHLTGLPVKHSLQGQVPYETTRTALLNGEEPPTEFQTVGGLRIELIAEPAGVANACFVAAGFDACGTLVDLKHGPGAVVVREEFPDRRS
jgi:hypothetical protein